MGEMGFLSAGKLAGLIASGEIGALEMLEHFLARVERFNPKLNAIVVPDFARARARAEAADRALAKGERWGPLHGLPMTIKESFNIAGLPTTWGVPEYRDNAAAADALYVRRLKEAGAVIFGKTNVPWMLQDFQSYNEIHGTTGNPWDTGRTPGGSSGGSAAALAAGLTGLDSGSDIGGSIRNPAHFCGIYGHKPTWGILPTEGHALADSITAPDISVVGPLARSADDLRLVLDLVGGPGTLAAPGWRLDLPEPAKTRLADYRVALWADDAMSEVDGAVVERLHAMAEALRRAGATVDEAARPDFPPRDYHALYIKLLRAVTSARQIEADFEAAVRQAEALDPAEESYRAWLLRGSTLRHRAWLPLNEARNQLRLTWRAFFCDWDLLLCPVTASAAFPHDHHPERMERWLTVNNKQVPYLDQLFWAGLAALCYLPATVAPIGPGADGLPVGVQIVGPEYADRTTIDFARLLAEVIGGYVPPPGFD
jgi:amidase